MSLRDDPGLFGVQAMLDQVHASLRDSPAAHLLARATDPTTIHAAARELVESGQLGKDESFALSMVTLYPGRTAAELEQKAGCKDGKLRKRLAGLRSKKQIDIGSTRKCEVGGSLCVTWWPVESHPTTEARAAS